MGIFDRLIRRKAATSEEQFWIEGVPAPWSHDKRINYAHLAIQTQSDLSPGTLFLTDKRIVYRFLSANGRYTGETMMYGLQDIRSVARPVDHQPGQFVLIAVQPDGEELGLLFVPRSSPSATVLAETLYEDLTKAHASKNR